MNPVTRAVAEHDDPNSKTHARDVAAKKRRDKISWNPEPAPEKGPRIEVGHFEYPRKGFSFRVKNGRASVADGPEYTKEVTALSEKLRKYKRVRTRNGKTKTDYNNHPNGGVVSLMVSFAPWHIGVVSRIGTAEREDLALRIAEAKAKRIKELNCGELVGGGFHEDVASHLHFHDHIKRSHDPSPDGTPGQSYGKKNFYYSKWSGPTWRTHVRFPNLLNPHKVEYLKENLLGGWEKLAALREEGKSEKEIEALVTKASERFIDIQLNKVVDDEVEAWAKSKGLQHQLDKDAKSYFATKSASEKRERSRTFTDEDMTSFERAVKTGVWEASNFAFRRIVRLFPKPFRKRARKAIFGKMRPPKLRLNIDKVARDLKSATKLLDQKDNVRNVLEISAHGLPR